MDRMLRGAVRGHQRRGAMYRTVGHRTQVATTSTAGATEQPAVDGDGRTEFIRKCRRRKGAPGKGEGPVPLGRGPVEKVPARLFQAWGIALEAKNTRG